MKIIFSDENRERTNDARRIADSPDLHNWINTNLSYAVKYEYGMERVQVYELRKVVERYYKGCDFEFGKYVTHDHGIGNNNQLYIKDLISGEFVAGVYFNSNMYGSVFFGVTDINGKRISDRYIVTRNGIRVNRD